MQQFFPALSPEKGEFFCNAWKSSPEESCAGCPMAETFTTGKSIERVRNIETIQGKRDFRVMTSPVVDEAGEVYAGICLYEDFTENLILERDLRQSQKIEAVGQLAAGIAHFLDEISAAIEQSIEAVGRVEKIVRAMKDFPHPGGDERRRRTSTRFSRAR
jgi:hypothetical protein